MSTQDWTPETKDDAEHEADALRGPDGGAVARLRFPKPFNQSDSNASDERIGSSAPNSNSNFFSRAVRIPPNKRSKFRYVEDASGAHALTESGEQLMQNENSSHEAEPKQQLSITGLRKRLTNVMRGTSLSPLPGGRRRKDERNGQLVYKGHPSWEIVLLIQFGLRYSSEKLYLSDDSELNDAQFLESDVFQFNHWDDNPIPSRSEGGARLVKWVHPSPIVYQKIRQQFNVPEKDFLEATCAESRILELPTPGKSGAMFYITDDEKYFMKTITGTEERTLMSMLPSYYAYVTEYPQTLLTKILAHFSVRAAHNNHVRMFAMSSIFDEHLYIDAKYDLKGSTFRRNATAKERNSENTTFKDNDFQSPIYFSVATTERILLQLEKDARYLESQNVMDYSLLLGLSYMMKDDDKYFKASFGPEEDTAPYEVGYQFDETKTKRGLRVSMGIIDFLQKFTPRKKLEYGMRIAQSCSFSNASVMPPSLYRRRFIKFLRSNLLPDPCFDIKELR